MVTELKKLIQDVTHNDLLELITFLVNHPDYIVKLNHKYRDCNYHKTKYHHTIKEVFDNIIDLHKCKDYINPKLILISIKEYFGRFHEYHDWDSLFIKSLIDIEDVKILYRRNRLLTTIDDNLYMVERKSYSCHSDDTTTKNTIYNRHIYYKEEKSNEDLADNQIFDIITTCQKDITNDLLKYHFVCYLSPIDMLYLLRNNHGINNNLQMNLYNNEFPIFFIQPNLKMDGKKKSLLKSMINNVVATKNKVVNAYTGAINSAVDKYFSLLDTSAKFELTILNKYAIPYFEKVISNMMKTMDIRGFIDSLLDHLISMKIFDQKTKDSITKLKDSITKVEYKIENMSHDIDTINATVSDYTDGVVSVDSISLLLVQLAQMVSAPILEVITVETGGWGPEISNIGGMITKIVSGVYGVLGPVMDIMGDIQGLMGSLTAKYSSLMEMETTIQQNVQIFINDLPETVKESLKSSVDKVKTVINTFISSIGDMISTMINYDGDLIARAVDVINYAVDDPSLTIKAIFGIIDFGKSSGIHIVSDVMTFIENMILDPEALIDKVLVNAGKFSKIIQEKMKLNIHTNNKAANILKTIMEYTPEMLLIKGMQMAPLNQVAEDVMKDIGKRVVGVVMYNIALLTNDMDMFNENMKIGFVKSVHGLNMALYHSLSKLYTDITGKTPSKTPVEDGNIQEIFNVNSVLIKIMVPLTIMLIEFYSNL